MAWGTANLGELNQIYGAFKAIEDLTGNTYEYEKSLLLPLGVSNIQDLKETLKLSQFSDYKLFKKEVFAILDNFLKAKKNRSKGVYCGIYSSRQ